MRSRCTPSLWAATAALALGMCLGCGNAIQEDKEVPLDRRQVDTYDTDSTSPDADPHPADPARGDGGVGAVEATGGH